MNFKKLIPITIFFILFYFIYSNFKYRFVFLKNYLLNQEQQNMIKQYLFPYRYQKQISKEKLDLRKELDNIKDYISKIEIDAKKSLIPIVFNSKDSDNKDFFKIYSQQNNLISSGIHENFPGSAFLDKYKENIFLLSSRGITSLANIKDGNNLKFIQIKNNLNNYLNAEQFKKGNWFSFKDLLIVNNKIFVSFTNEVKKDCWNISVLESEMNYKFLEFKKLFAPAECYSSFDKPLHLFNARQSGGRMVKYNKNNLFLTVGDFRAREKAQDLKSIFGKILKINTENGSSKLITYGHRNAQGLFFNNRKQTIFFTEHGPQGGDEFNMFELGSKNNNYGWPIASYGEHYGDRNSIKNIELYSKFPLLKSHKDNGFVEPIHFFDPSVGISEIICLQKNNFECLISSLKAKSLYLILLNNKKQLESIESIFIGERIRDMMLLKNKIYIFMENTASIGEIDLNLLKEHIAGKNINL